MLRKNRIREFGTASWRMSPAGVIAMAAVSIGGCSADVGRFDFSSVGPSSSTKTAAVSTPMPSEPLRRNAGIPVDNEDLAPRERQPQPYGAPRPMDRAPSDRNEPTVRMSGLPEAVSREPSPRAAPQPPPSRALPPARTETKPAPVAAVGEQIEVQPGDTLYGLSKKHRVPISELMSVNNLQTPAIKPGQKLTLPASPKGRRTIAQRPAAVAPQAVAEPLAPVAVRTAAPADWSGTHIVAAGESVYGIARKHKVKPADLQAINNISDPTKVRPGTPLKVPGDGAAEPRVVASAPTSRQDAAAPAAAPSPAATPGSRPTIINAPQAAAPETRVAALGSGTQPQKSDASPAETKAEPVSFAQDTPKATTAGKFRWPAKGKIIANFGPRPDGTHNDGINLSVPKGTDVHAAENGVVAYAGNELKGYGNLVLVRHDGNWVSAYAHNDALLVKRGDKIKRGQTIAKAGNSGAVDQPQVHFELRQGSKPVDPLPHMEKQ